jgi:hypothetical protein
MLKRAGRTLTLIGCGGFILLLAAAYLATLTGDQAIGMLVVLATAGGLVILVPLTLIGGILWVAGIAHERWKARQAGSESEH